MDTSVFGGFLMKNKDFDCVKMKELAQKNIQHELQGKSPAEQIVFWQTAEQQFRQGKPNIHWIKKETTDIPRQG